MSADKKIAKKAYDAARYLAKKDKVDARNKAWNLANSEKKKAYDVAHRAANIDAHKAYNIAYRENNREKNRQMIAAWRANNPKYNSRYYAANKEKLKSRFAVWYKENKHRVFEKSAEWYRKNPEKKIAKTINYYCANKHSIMEASARKRAARILRTAPWYGEFDALVMVEAYSLCKLREQSFGFSWDVDHIYPMQGKTVSGLHCGENVQVIPTIYNLKKHNKLLFLEPLEWLKA